MPLDTCKIAPGGYQYTAVDDGTRDRVLAIFRRRPATSTPAFLERVLEEMPFPMQRVQPDRGREFFAVSVQQLLMDHCIKFRPIKPASPHLKGTVERSQKPIAKNSGRWLIRTALTWNGGWPNGNTPPTGIGLMDR